MIKPGNSTAPVAVSGIITLTPQTPTTDSVAYSVDGQPVNSDKLDTSKLSDGEHVVEQITTDSKGKQTTSKQTIKVENVWQYQLVRGVQGHWQVISGIVLLLVVIVGGIVYALTHHIFGIGDRTRLHDNIAVSSVPKATISTSTTPSNIPTILPDAETQASVVAPPIEPPVIAPLDPPASADSPPPNNL